MHLRGFAHVVENAYHSEHRRGIDSFAQGFVVEAHIAASDGNLKLLAGFRDAIDGLRELPHDVRLLRITKVETIGCAHRSRARTGNLAGRLGHSMHGTEPRIEVTPATVAIERHGQPAPRTLNTNHARIARTGRLHCVGLHHVIVLLPYPALAADVRTSQELTQ